LGELGWDTKKPRTPLGEYEAHVHAGGPSEGEQAAVGMPD
jgi:hypothetical protein